MWSRLTAGFLKSLPPFSSSPQDFSSAFRSSQMAKTKEKEAWKKTTVLDSFLLQFARDSKAGKCASDYDPSVLPKSFFLDF